MNAWTRNHLKKEMNIASTEWEDIKQFISQPQPHLIR